MSVEEITMNNQSTEDFSSNNLICLKYAQISSVNAEWNFLAYKNIFWNRG